MSLFTYRALPLLLAGLLAGTAHAQSWNWARGAAARNEGAPRAIALDPATGQTVIAGTFNDSLRYDNVTLRCEGWLDGYIGRVDAQGQWVSIFRVGGPGADRIQQVKIAPNGDVVVVGAVGRGALPIPNQPDSLQSFMFVARYTSGGQLVWANVVEADVSDGTTVYSDGIDLGLDNAGNIYVTGGVFVSSPTPGSILRARFGAQLALDSLRNGVFVAKLSGSGQWDWVREIRDHSYSSQTVGRLAVAGNQVLVAGNWARSYGPGSGGPPSAANTYVSAYDATTGQARWTIDDVTGTLDYADVGPLVADDHGRFFIASQGQSLHLGAFQASNGQPLWVSTFESGSYTALGTGGLALTPAGELTLGGFAFFMPGMSCGGPGGGPSGPPVTALSGAVAFSDSTIVRGGYVARFDAATGALRWVLEVPAPVNALADDGLGHTRIGGTYGGGDGVFATAVPTPINYNTWWGNGPLVAELNENGPLLRALSPDTVALGAAVRLLGRHLTGTTRLTVGATAVPFQVVSDEEIRFTVTTPVNGSIAVVTPLGNATGLNLTTLVPTGIGADAAAAGVALWPNPARTDVRVAGLGGQPQTVEVRNALGQVVRRVPAAGTSAVISVADLPAGIYTVRAGARTVRLVVE